MEKRNITIWQTSQRWLMKTGGVNGWVEVWWKTRYWHSLVVFFHKIFINYKKGNGDFMVNTGRQSLVQTQGYHHQWWDDLTSCPPAVKHWEEHSTIFRVLARNTWLVSCHEETSDGSKLSMTQVTLENKKCWLFKTVKDETVMERQKSCSRPKETHDCYVRRWPCFGKYILKLQDWMGLMSIYNLLSNGSEKHWTLNNWVSRRRETGILSTVPAASFCGLEIILK